MKRVSALRRTRLAPVGAKGRAFNAKWLLVRAQRLEMDAYRCRACGAGGLAAIATGAGPRLEIHHIVKRSKDKTARLRLSNLVTLCPPCHAQTDRPYAKGRLVITKLEDGGLVFEIVTKADKWTA